ncbi:MAG: peptidylprolyl isomerase, partial [Planctomycetota bacterium]
MRYFFYFAYYFSSILATLYAQEKKIEPSAVLIEVGTEKITARDFFDRLHLSNPQVSQELLEELILQTWVELASKKNGVVATQDEIFQLVQKEVEYCRQEADRLQLKLSVFLKTKYNITEAQFIKLAEKRSRLKILLGQVLRYEDGLEDRVVLRICSLKTKEEAQKIYEQAKAGADFETLIKENDVNPVTRKTGGKTRPMTENDFPPEYSEIKKQAFLLKPLIELSPILEVEEQDKSKTFAILKVIERKEPWNKPFS